MKIKNISAKSSFTARISGYDGGVISLKPGDIKRNIPLKCYKGFKGVPNLIKLCWENDSEIPTLSKLSKIYYNVGEFETPTDQAQEPQTPIEVASIQVTKDKIELKVGEKELLEFTVLPEDAENKDVTFTSSDESIATVSKKGKVIAVAEGSTTVTITSANNVTVTVDVVVTPVEEVTEESGEGNSTEENPVEG